MKTITVTMRLYGAFRKYQDSVTFSVPAGSPVSDIKDSLGRTLGPQAFDLVMDSVIANDKTILPPDFIVDEDISLSILPPVCGG